MLTRWQALRSMERANGPSLHWIRAGCVGDHLVKIARLGGVDRVTDQIGSCRQS